MFPYRTTFRYCRTKLFYGAQSSFISFPIDPLMLTRTDLLFSWLGGDERGKGLEKIDRPRPREPICRQTELGELRLLLVPRSGSCNPICNDAAEYWLVFFPFPRIMQGTFAFRVFLAAVASVTASDFIPQAVSQHRYRCSSIQDVPENICRKCR